MDAEAVEEPARLAGLEAGHPGDRQAAGVPGDPDDRGVPAGRPGAGLGPASVTARLRPRSRSTRRSAPLASYLRPGRRPPGRDRVLVALERAVRRDLRAEAEAVQQERHPAQRVGDAGQPLDQRGDPGQGPPLVLLPAVGRRAGLQRGAQLRDLLLVQLAGVPAGAFRGQRRFAAGLPGAPPLVDRLRADPQRTRDLPGVRRRARTSPRPAAAPARGGTGPPRSARRHPHTS